MLAFFGIDPDDFLRDVLVVVFAAVFCRVMCVVLLARIFRTKTTELGGEGEGAAPARPATATPTGAAEPASSMEA